MRCFSSLILTLSLLGCKAEEDPIQDCAHEESAQDLVSTSLVPDWQTELIYTAADLGLEREEGISDEEENLPVLRERIQAWDCLDLSWWSPAGPRKVVQIWTDETECSLFERAEVEYFPCDSHEGDDDPYRDKDQDGYYESEGDCDDGDMDAYPDATEICDDSDNNCDGLIDEGLVCEEADTLD